MCSKLEQQKQECEDLRQIRLSLGVQLQESQDREQTLQAQVEMQNVQIQELLQISNELTFEVQRKKAEVSL